MKLSRKMFGQKSLITAFPVQFTLVAYNHKIRLNYSKGIVNKFYIKRGMKHLAGAFLVFDIGVENTTKMPESVSIGSWIPAERL